MTFVIKEKTKHVSTTTAFGSKNPKTGQYYVNIIYLEEDEKITIRLLCQEDEVSSLVANIREDKIVDVSSYIAETVE